MRRKTSKLVNMISVILATVALIMTGYLVVGMVRPQQAHALATSRSEWGMCRLTMLAAHTYRPDMSRTPRPSPPMSSTSSLR